MKVLGAEPQNGRPVNVVYADASALAKLLTPEAETAAVRSYLGNVAHVASSAITEVELMRVAHRLRPGHVALAAQVMSSIDIVAVTPALLHRAAHLLPGATLRSLDAIHLASALAVSEVDFLLTYDGRMADAAGQFGLRALAPQ